jgi:patatin-like phospholipase/acyl hydrolase
MVFDDAVLPSDGPPGFFEPYFSREPIVMDEAHDYVDETATARNATTYTWIHPLSDIISSLLHSRFGSGLVSRARRRDVADVQDIGAGR